MINGRWSTDVNCNTSINGLGSESQEINDLSADLKTGRYSSTVQVRLLRLWEARNVRRGGEFMEVVMLLLDSQLIPENPGGFKSLIKIPPAQAVELLYFSDSPSSSSQEAADGSDIGECLCEYFGWFFIGWVLLDTHSVHNLGIVLLLFLITQ
ncbi:hypothetical protein YC2023_117104 [Brassica napus]